MLKAAVRRVIPGRVLATRHLAKDLAALPRELTNAWAEEFRHIPNPPKHGTVLEIGSGQSPHPLATMVVDKYITDDFERPGGQALSFERPLVIGDGEALPFADRTFDYVIALHVLEHASDPTKFAAEIARIGDRGFVQVPTRESELVFGWPFHGWLIDREGDRLIFSPKGEREPVVGDLFHKSVADSALFRSWFALRRSTWHHSIEFKGTLAVTVQGEPNRGGVATFDLDATSALLRQLEASDAVRGPSPEQFGWLRCPACIGTLSRGQETLQCGGCQRVYPVVASVPILLQEAAR